MYIADLHIHSKYSRATSKNCEPEALDLWARRKGINLVGTGDFTHPAWREELRERLAPAEEGLYILKNEFRLDEAGQVSAPPPRFILTGEISSIYKKNGRVRKVHNLILLPSLEAAESLAKRLELVGNLHSDGRPILGLDSRDLLEITLEACPDAVFIPAHIWTPHFSLFGAYSGFDDIRECFEDLTPHIHALETGLSSDPPMNWRVSALDGYNLVSHSDAHSPANLGREATMFETELSYPALKRALEERDSDGCLGTIEFFPEEGKYHFDGHRNCKVCLKPSETIARDGICPVCGKKVTVGVLHRVEALADREEGFVLPNGKRFESIVPLPEAIAASTGVSAGCKKVTQQYETMLREIGPEFFILREAPLDEIEACAGPCIAEGIRRIRYGEVEPVAGFDGQYGFVKVLSPDDIDRLSGQVSLLPDGFATAKNETVGWGEAQAVPEDTEKQEEVVESTNPYGLNDEQWQAAASDAPSVAVIAGPGTGKTRTLVYRIAHLVENCGVSPADITAVTFTNKAANEMRERLAAHFGGKRLVKNMKIGTFHSICLKLLENWGVKVIIADARTTLSIMEEVVNGRTRKPRQALAEISKIKCGMPVEESDELAEIRAAYDAQLRQYGVMDYDDILLEALRLGEEKGGLPFSHLLVDEFQDSNDVQFRLIRQWAQENIFIIGDPDQSIYGFRGSDARCFERFFDAYPDTVQIRLVQNYRSTPEIINSALPVVGRDNGDLRPNRESGADVRLVEAESPFSEAIFIAKEINRLVGGIDMLDAHTAKKREGKVRGLSDIAILYRTHRQAEVIEHCLIQEGIPYTVAGQEDFLSDPQVRGAVSFFRYLANPGDLLSLRECLTSVGIRPQGQMRLEEYERTPEIETFIAACKRFAPRVDSEPPAALLEEWLTGKMDACDDFESDGGNKQTGDEMETATINDEREPAGSYNEKEIASSGDEKGAAGSDNEKRMSRHGSEKESATSGVADSKNKNRSKAVDRLIAMAVMHKKMKDFLQTLALGRESDLVRSGTKSYLSDAVSLMTLHGAKGLEFPVVFLSGVTEGLIPYESRGRESDTGEERRLFYVGMTRAQDELVLLTSQQPSPFLDTLPGLVFSEAFPKREEEPNQMSLFD